MEKNTCTVVGNARVRPAGAELTLEEATAEAMRCTASNPCVYCEVCQLMCPDLCITRDEKNGQIQIDLNYCKGCGLCALFCPHGAIEMVIDE